MESMLKFNKTEVVPSLAAFQNYVDTANINTEGQNSFSAMLEDEISITAVLGGQSSAKTSVQSDFY